MLRALPTRLCCCVKIKEFNNMFSIVEQQRTVGGIAILSEQTGTSLRDFVSGLPRFDPLLGSMSSGKFSVV